MLANLRLVETLCRSTFFPISGWPSSSDAHRRHAPVTQRRRGTHPHARLVVPNLADLAPSPADGRRRVSSPEKLRPRLVSLTRGPPDPTVSQCSSPLGAIAVYAKEKTNS